MTHREVYNEKSENGLIMGNRYIPEELLTEIFCYIDFKSLLNCQLVCRRWNVLIQCYVWRKKAEMTVGRSLPPDKEIAWRVYYMICKKKPFERNLIKNNSGEHGVHRYWQILSEGGDRWKVENPPVGVPPLPANEPVFEGRQSCFATSFYSCIKTQMIDLESEGLDPYILDTFQPTVVISEWYSCRWDCPAIYECVVNLIGKDNSILDSFQFRDSIEGDNQNMWHHTSHEFENYGPGLRKIVFYHGGSDTLFWAGHYGSKMAGACVFVKTPSIKRSVEEEKDEGEEENTSPDVD